MDHHFASLIQSPETTGSALLVGLVDALGYEVLEWDPTTIRMEIEAEWHAKPPQINLDKIQSLLTYLTTNLFYTSLEAFGHICCALNDEEADFEHYSMPDISQMAWAVAECTLLQPPKPGDPADTFSEEIKDYIRAQLEVEGFTRVPKMLAGVVVIADKSEDIESTFNDEGITAKSYFDSQMRKVLEVDQYVSMKLIQLMTEISALQLQHADAEAVKGLRARAQKAARQLQSEIVEERESSSPSPTL